MSSIVYLKNIPLAKKVFASTLMLLGIGIFLTTNIFTGIFFFVIGLNLIATEGTEINLTEKKFRTIKSVLGKKFGKWKACPEFEYVSVFKTKESTGINAYGARVGTFKTDIILLNLFYDRNKHITFYKTEEVKDAIKVAQQIKEIFNIRIYDPANLQENSTV